MLIRGIKSRLNNSRGFTLMELIIVIAILAILVTMALLYYGNLTDDADRNALLNDLNAVNTGITMYKNTYKALPFTADTTVYLDAVIPAGITNDIPNALKEPNHVAVYEISAGNVNFMEMIRRTSFLLKPGSETGDVKGHGKVYYVESVSEIASGTAAGGTANTITIVDPTGQTADDFNGGVIYITGGTGAGQSRTITAYDGTTGVTVSPNWTTNPVTASSTYSIRPPVKKGDIVFLQSAATDSYMIKDADGNLIYK